MSLILEALKKSEAKRRLGDAPDLGTPFTVARPRRNWLPLGVIAIAIAVGAGAWLLRQPATTAIVPNPAPPAISAASARAQVPAMTQKPLLNKSAPSVQVATQFPPHQPNPASPARPAAEIASTTAHKNASPAAATFVQPGSAMPSSGHEPVPTGASKTATTAAATPGPAAVRATATAPPVASTTAATPALSPAGVPMYYELPFNVRQALPPLKLSMHVYAVDPAQRFVILDDSRLHEGDKTVDGVLVRTIRPDGIILEFQDQQFFYPRDGF